MLDFEARDADRAGGGEGGVVGDDLELIVDEQFQLVADDFEAQVAGAGEDAGEVLGEAELLIGLAVLFQEDGGFELAAARVVVDQADIEVAGELASAGVAGDHAGVGAGGDRDVGRGDGVGDGGRVQGGEAEIGDDTGGGSGVVLDVNVLARSVQTRSRSELFAWVKLSVKGRVVVGPELQRR